MIVHLRLDGGRQCSTNLVVRLEILLTVAAIGRLVGMHEFSLRLIVLSLK